MRLLISLIVLVTVTIGFSASANHLSSTSAALTFPSEIPRLQPGSLCTKDEQIIFSCLVKRPAKIVSLCGSKDLAKERGYLQYRFGLPGKVELEFPNDRQGTQAKFQYTHYMRFQVDLTEINFNINGYEYQIFDTYNGEEKPKISTQGVSVTAPGKPKDVSFVCRTKAKADFSNLPDVLPNQQ